MNRRNAVNIIFSAIVSVGFVLLGFFVFSSSYLRAFEAGGNLRFDQVLFLGAFRHRTQYRSRRKCLVGSYEVGYLALFGL